MNRCSQLWTFCDTDQLEDDLDSQSRAIALGTDASKFGLLLVQYHDQYTDPVSMWNRSQYN